MRYVKTFFITAPCFAVFYVFVTRNNPVSIKWWPDSAIFGFFLGLVTTVAYARIRSMMGPNLVRLLGTVFRKNSTPPAT